MAKNRHKRQGGDSRDDARLGYRMGFDADDPFRGEDVQRGKSAVGTVGPAKRGFQCDGQCWTPNRFGMCMVCGGSDPVRRAA